MVRPSQIGRTGSVINYNDITYECNENKPKIENFIPTPREKGVKEQLLVDLHLALLLRYHCGSGSHLPSITNLIHCLRKQAHESECSNVVYADILSEKADCKSTQLKVIGNLHKIYIKELHQKWVIVVGDAKVYDLLQAIRIDYGNNLKCHSQVTGILCTIIKKYS
jgi:hypothetical protein